jgi:ABC-type polysaccharide/polyol phosphate export permease
MSTASTDIAAEPTEPPANLRYRRRVHLAGSMGELWNAKGLVRTLVERDIRVRYKRTFLGVGWAIVNPVLFMVVFTFFFQRAAHVSTDGVPYALFSYIALVPWSFFSEALTLGSASLIGNLSLLNKVYCPREVFPVASLLTSAFDTLMSVVVLAVLFVAYGVAPAAQSVWVPLLILVEVAFTLGLALFLSSALIYLRDLRYAVPLVVQLGMFVSPVAYSITSIPRAVRPVYDVLNPMGPVLDSFRRTVLHDLPPQWGALGLAAAAAIAWLFGGYILFKRLETGFADMA